jgi:hypothetical protein
MKLLQYVRFQFKKKIITVTGSRDFVSRLCSILRFLLILKNHSMWRQQRIILINEMNTQQMSQGIFPIREILFDEVIFSLEWQFRFQASITEYGQR